MAETKNKCPKCGGRLVAEYIGNYGDVFLLNSNGKSYKGRLKRHIYEHDGEPPMIYCNDCGAGYERCGQAVKREAEDEQARAESGE